jgi:hypothetical protein
VPSSILVVLVIVPMARRAASGRATNPRRVQQCNFASPHASSLRANTERGLSEHQQELTMTLKTWLLGAAAAVAFGAAGTTAQAAPLGNMQANAVEQNSPGLNVAWVRQCHFHRGHRHCRRLWPVRWLLLRRRPQTPRSPPSQSPPRIRALTQRSPTKSGPTCTVGPLIFVPLSGFC